MLCFCPSIIIILSISLSILISASAAVFVSYLVRFYVRPTLCLYVSSCLSVSVCLYLLSFLSVSLCPSLCLCLCDCFHCRSAASPCMLLSVSPYVPVSN